MVGNRLGHALVYGKSAAPVPYVLAKRDEGGVFIILVNDWLCQSVSELVYRRGRIGLPVFVKSKALFTLQLLDAGAFLLGQQHLRLSRRIHRPNRLVGEHQIPDVILFAAKQVDSRRNLFIDRQLHVANHVSLDLLFDILQISFAADACLYKLFAECHDGILLLPHLYLLFRAVAGGIRRGMSGKTVCHNVQQHRAVLLCQRNLPLVSVDYCQRIEAVHPLRMELRRRYSRSNACHHVVAHCLAAGLSAHAVEIVVNIVDKRHRTAVLTPKGADLIHRRHHHALPHGAAGHCTVANVAYDESRLLIAQLVERRTYRYRAASAYDSVVRIDSEWCKERMHRTAQSLVKTVLSAKRLRHHSIQQEIDTHFLGVFGGILNDIVRIPAEEALHNLHHFVVIDDFNGAEAARYNLAVAPVGAEGSVVQRQIKRLAHISRLLSDAQMSRTGMIVVHTLILCLRLDLVKHGLKLTHIPHIAINVQKLLFRKILDLILHRLLICVYGNI